MNIEDLKVGAIIDKNTLGEIGNIMEGNPKVICISYTLYDEKSTLQTEVKIKTKDYEEIQKYLNGVEE